MEIRTPQNNNEWKAYYKLRYEVLRKPLKQPEGSEKNDGDKTGVHFALFEKGNIKAIGRLDWVDEKTSQPRFVAVDPSEQGKGFGKIIMTEIEEYSLKHKRHHIVLKARDYAIPFYESLNYKVTGKAHLLFGILQHFTMEKKLS